MFVRINVLSWFILSEHEVFIGTNDARAKPHTESRLNKSLAA